MGCSSHHRLRTFLMDHLPDWTHSWGIVNHLLLETPAHIQCLPQTHWEANASDCPRCMTLTIIQPLWGPVATSIRWSSERENPTDISGCCKWRIHCTPIIL